MEKNRYTEEERAQALYLAMSKGTKEASEVTGISRFTISDWRRRELPARGGIGSAGLAEENRRLAEANRLLQRMVDYLLGKAESQKAMEAINQREVSAR